MAEQVQAVLDRMVEGLHDLLDRGVLNEGEIQSIVARRRTSEYLLRRRNPRKSDYLSYIQAETALERLRQLRVKRLKLEQKQSDQQQNAEQSGKHVGDKHIIQHLHLLWVRTLRKYRADVGLYLKYAEFCKESKSFKRLAACYQEALRYHPHCIQLWIEAASHEFFECHSCQNARVLLQRALRLHPASQDLWVQSFVLELHFVQKLRGRRAVLLGTKTDEAAKEVETEKEEDDTTYYKIAVLVYDNAIQSAADSVGLRLAFLDQCGHFPATERVEAHIINSIQRDYADTPSAWIARAVYQKNKQQKESMIANEKHENQNEDDEPLAKRPKTSVSNRSVDPVLETVRDACSTLRTDEMILQAVRFLQRYASSSSAENEESDDEISVDNAAVEQRKRETHTLIRELLSEASTSDFYSSALALLHADYLAEQSDCDAAIASLQNYVENKNEIPAAVWVRWAGLVYNNDEEKAFLILEKGLKVIPIHQSDYMVVLLQLLAARLQSAGAGEDKVLSDLFQRVLLLAPGFQQMEDVEHPVVATIPNLPTACRRYIQCMLSQRGISGFRKACDAVLFQSSLVDQLTAMDADSVKLLLDECIEAELADRSNRKRLIRLYDAAIQAFSDTPLAANYRQRRAEEVVYR